MIKRDLIQQLVAELGREIGVLRQAALAAREAATHEEAKPENDKDTRAIEAAYLAGAQADRVRELERSANALEFLELRSFASGDPIALSALIDLEREDTGEELSCLLAPHAGGVETRFEGRRVMVVTPEAPLGRALLGKTQGDVIEVPARGAVREYAVTRVR